MNVNSGGNPMLDALDCPVPSVKTPQRSTTTTPLQSLEPDEQPVRAAAGESSCGAFVERGYRHSLARRRGFLLAFGRLPQAGEVASAVSLVDRHGLESFCWGLFNTSEFVYVH